MPELDSIFCSDTAPHFVSCFQFFVSVETLHIECNYLTGSITASVCSERGLRFQQLATLIVDCVVDCSCCDNCRDSCSEEFHGRPPATWSPTSAVWHSLGAVEKIEHSFGSNYLGDPNSTQFKALEWLIQEDPWEIESNTENFIQRFVLVLFYLETSQKGEWLSCGKPEDSEESCYYYKLLTTQTEPWQYQEQLWKHWLSGLHECEWAGVLCDPDTDIVTDIILGKIRVIDRLQKHHDSVLTILELLNRRLQADRVDSH